MIDKDNPVLQKSNVDSSRNGSGRGLLTAFWHLAAPFWKSRAALRSILLVILLIAIFFIQGKLIFANSARLAEFNNTIVNKNVDNLFPVIRIVVSIMVGTLFTEIVSSYIKLWIEIDWRVWLTQNFSDRWLDQKRYYNSGNETVLDNPDQRILDDVFLFLDITIPFILALATIVTSLYVYGVILWTVGGPLVMHWSGSDYLIPGGIFWGTWTVLLLLFPLLYFSALPLIKTTVVQQRREGDFRFSMAVLRVNSAEVALYGGAQSEMQRFNTLFDLIVQNWKRVMLATLAVTFVSYIYEGGLPIAAFFPGYDRYLSGQIDYGQLGQIGLAVGAITGSLTWFAHQLRVGLFSTWAAAVRRLDAFSVELSRPRVSGIRVTAEAGAHAESLLETRALILARPDGRVLASPGDLTFRAGERWLLEGESGAGKSTMLRAMAGLWPHGQGAVRFDPAARERTLFLPQKSYVPVGPLIDALNYPAIPGTFTPDACIEALRLVRLDGLVDNLDEDARWQERLSPGEQQRLAFVRVFLHEPEIILLDEATSALDPANENHLYSLLNERLPNALVISIAHRKELARYHEQTIRICAIGC